MPEVEPKLRPWPASQVRMLPLEQIKPYPRNVLVHTPEQVQLIADSMQRFGVTAPLLVDESGVLIYGHGRLLAAQSLGYERLPVSVAEGWSEEEKSAYRIADNQIGRVAEWDLPALKLEVQHLQLQQFDMPLLGFPDIKIVEFTAGLPGAGAPPVTAEQAKLTLAERFGAVPFSVFNAREGWWQDRKRAWIALGIQSELGRGENLIGRSPQELFCHHTGIPYDQARKIVTDAMAAATEEKPFNLSALIEAHGGKSKSGSDFSRVTMSPTVQRLKPSADQALKRAQARQLGGEV